MSSFSEALTSFVALIVLHFLKPEKSFRHDLSCFEFEFIVASGQCINFKTEMYVFVLVSGLAHVCQHTRKKKS